MAESHEAHRRHESVNSLSRSNKYEPASEPLNIYVKWLNPKLHAATAVAESHEAYR